MTEATAPEGQAPQETLSEDPIEVIGEAAAAEAPAEPTPAPPAPTGLKAQALQVALKGFMKLPPPAQQGVMKGAMKVGPVIAKVAPYRNQVLAATGTLVVLRKVRNRGR